MEMVRTDSAIKKKSDLLFRVNGFDVSLLYLNHSFRVRVIDFRNGDVETKVLASFPDYDVACHMFWNYVQLVIDNY